MKSRTIVGGIVLGLTIVALAPLPAALAAPPGFTKVFTPDEIGPGSVSTLTFTIDNTGEAAFADELDFSDTLPAGVVIATPPNASTACGPDAGGDGPTVSTPAGGSTISLTDAGVGAGTTCTVSVDVTSSTAATHMNVSGDLTSSAGNSGTAADDLVVTTGRPGFSKDFSPDPIDKGERSTLTFTIDNTANGSGVASLDFIDNLPAGLAIADPSNASTDCGTALVPPTLTADPGTAVVILDADGVLPTFPAVAAGSICTVEVDVVATGSGTLFNSSSSLQASFLDAGKATATLDVTVSDLHLTKEFTDDPIPPGGTATLEITIENFDRDFPATDVDVSDTLPAGVVVAAAPPATNDCGGTLTAAGSLIELDGGTIAAEGFCTITVPVTAPATGTYVNTSGAVSGMVDGGAVIGNEASDILFVVPAPTLAKEFTDDPVAGGGVVTAEFTITNTSSVSTATDIAFEDEFPIVLPTSPSGAPADGFCGGSSTASFTPLSDPGGGGSATPATLTVSGASLAAAGTPGDSCTFSLTLDVIVGAAAGLYPNVTSDITATVEAMSVTGEPATDDLEVVAAPTLDKEFTDDPIAPGDPVTLEFTLGYDPLAASDATGITFTDDLAATVAGLTGDGATTTDVCGPGNGTVTWSAGATLLTFSGGTLAPGETCVFSVPLTTTAATPQGIHGNTTSDVSATVTSLAVTELPATDDLTVVDLTFTKEFTDDPVFPGDTVSVTFTIDNASPTDDATSISFSDDFDATLDSLALTAAEAATLPRAECGGTLFDSGGGSAVTLVGGSLTAGTGCSFTVELDVPASADAGAYPNATSGFGASIDGSPFIPLPNATDDLVVDEAALNIAKSFTDDPVEPGDTVTLRITLGNDTVSEPATALAFTDDLEATLSGLTATGSFPVTEACIPVAPGGGPGPGPGTGTLAITGTQTLDFSGGTLAAGDACIIVVTLTVPGGAAAANYPNTTSALTGDVAGNPIVATAATDVLKVLEPAPSSADLSVSKTDSPDPVTAGETLIYTITVDNAGISDAANVIVTDVLPAGVTYVSDTDSCVEGPAGTLTCSLGIVPIVPGSVSFDVEVTVDSDTAAGTITNDVSVTSNTSDPDTSNNAASEDTTVEVVADLAISKTDSPDPVVAGETLTYTVTVDNLGPSDATGVTVVDTLPAGVTYVSDTDACVEGPSGTLTCTLGTIAAGAASSFDVEVTVDTDTPAGDIANLASVTSAVPDPVVANSVTIATTTVETEADLAITKTDDADPAVAGETVTYTIEVENFGPSDATGVEVVDTVPAGFMYDSDTDSCTPGVPAPGFLTCDLGTIAAGDSASFDVTFTIASDVLGDVDNVVDVSSDATDPVGGNDTATETTTIVAEADLVIFKVGDSPVAAGDSVTYSFSVDNLGPSDASGVTVVDDVPAGMMFDSVSVPCTPGDPAPGFLTCDLGTITAGGTSGVFDVTFFIDPSAPPGTVTNEATVASDATEVDPSDNTATEDTEIVAEADLAITKVDTDDPVLAGESVTYEIVVENFGPSDATGVTVVDTVPAGLMFGSADVPCTPGDPGPGFLTCDLGTLEAGFGITFEVTFDVDPAADAGEVENEVTVSSDAADPVPDDNSAAETTTIEVEADLAIDKEDDPDPVTAGETLTFTIEVDNFGPSDATGVTVVDTLPSGVTYVSDTDACVEAPAGTLTCDLGTIPVFDSESFEITVTVDSGTTGTLTNTATVTSDAADPDTSDNTVTAETAVETVADLSIAKSDSPDPVTAGESLTYTITVTNDGPSDATGAVVTDTLPAGVTYVSDTDSCVEAPAGTLTCSLGTIAGGDTVSFDVTVDVDPGATGSLTNTASVTSDAADPDTSDNTATATTAVETEADMRIAKTDSPDPVRLGQTITYVVTVTNDGPSDATGVVVTDTLPAGLAQARTSGCAEDDRGVPTCTLGTIAAGASRSYTITARVTGNTTRVLANTASVSSDAADPDTSDNSATAFTTVSRPQQPEVGLFDPVTGHWTQLLRNGSTRTFTFGNPGDYGIVGDWDGDGDRTPGVFRTLNGDTGFFVRNSNSSGPADFFFVVGEPGDIPVAGDWNGNGMESLGLYRPSTATWFVFFDFADVVPDAIFVFGNPGDDPSSVDIDGDGDSDPVAYRNMGALGGHVFIRRSLSTGPADRVFIFGNPADRVLFGDYDYDGAATVGTYRPGDATFYLRNTNTTGVANLTIPFGLGRELPYAGPF